MDESNPGVVSVPPKMDLTSDALDAKLFFSCPYEEMIELLPNPEVKPYNNLAEYHSHNFLKKESRKRKEKERYYERPYSWYYSIMGWDQETINRYEKRQQRKKKKYQGWRTAKMRKYKSCTEDEPNREPCRGFSPLKSTKIIQLELPFRKRKIIPLNKGENSLQNLISDKNEATDDFSNKVETDHIESDLNSFIDLVNKTRTSVRDDSKNDDLNKNSTIVRKEVIRSVSKKAKTGDIEPNINKTRISKRDDSKNGDLNKNSKIVRNEEICSVSKKAKTGDIEPNIKDMKLPGNSKTTKRMKCDLLKTNSTALKSGLLNSLDKAETEHVELNSTDSIKHTKKSRSSQSKSKDNNKFNRNSMTGKREIVTNVLDKEKNYIKPDLDSSVELIEKLNSSKKNLNNTFQNKLKLNYFQKRYLEKLKLNKC